MAKLKYKLIPGPTVVHYFNGGFLIPNDHSPKHRLAIELYTKTKAFKPKYVQTLIMVRMDPSANKYDERGKRRPETLPPHRRRPMEIVDGAQSQAA